MDLFAPGWKKKDPEKVLRWIGHEKENSEALLMAVRCRKETEIRRAAAARISDLNMLSLIVSLVRDDALLEDIIRTKKPANPKDAQAYLRLQKKAAAAIGNQAVLAELARDHYACAAEVLTDQKALYAMAADPDSSMRMPTDSGLRRRKASR